MRSKVLEILSKCSHEELMYLAEQYYASSCEFYWSTDEDEQELILKELEEDIAVMRSNINIIRGE